MQFDTYASTAGGLGMAGADVPRGEGPASRVKRERSEDDEDDHERRVDDTYDAEEDTKRLRGDRDEE
jgi:nuclear cap-binding protein subunit 2